MRWQQLILEQGSLDPGDVETALLEQGAVSVTLTDAGDEAVLEPALGETPLWRKTRITGLFPGDADIPAVIAALKSSFGSAAMPAHRLETLDERDWEREWLRDLGPMAFGKRLWICPGESSAPPGSAVVRLDPGLAFGTGTHATTALCLEWLAGLDLAGRRVLDYGCGSGVLAIAALKLGADHAVALDIDPQAAAATRANAVRNDVGDRIEILTDADAVAGRFDVIVANILAGPLISLAESITTRLSSAGTLALSGILSAQVNKIQAAYGRRIAFDTPVVRPQGGQQWALLCGTRKDG